MIQQIRALIARHRFAKAKREAAEIAAAKLAAQAAYRDAVKRGDTRDKHTTWEALKAAVNRELDFSRRLAGSR